jgi:hypothetical protein
MRQMACRAALQAARPRSSREHTLSKGGPEFTGAHSLQKVGITHSDIQEYFRKTGIRISSTNT